MSLEPTGDVRGADAGVCPYQVANPVMIQRWNVLTLLHWRFPPDAVQRLLPPGHEVEVYDERW